MTTLLESSSDSNNNITATTISPQNTNNNNNDENLSAKNFFDPLLDHLNREQQVHCLTQEQNNCTNSKVQSQPLNLKICQTTATPTTQESLVVPKTDESQNKSLTDLNTATENSFVVRYADTYQVNSEENYRMVGAQRGICLIINNVNFDVFPERKGSDMDAYRFKRIFAQLGFIVESKRNVTADKMKAIFKQTASRCLIDHDALIVIILSHGTESGIYGVDGLEVDLNDVLTYFDNKRCRLMIGKPKVFIIQACRGRLSDYGVKDTQSGISQQDTQSAGFTQPSQLTQSYSQRPKIARWTEFDKNNHPTRADMLLCFSCHTGYLSTRNEHEGSWLGASLAKYIQQESYRLHLIQILNMVSREVRKKKSSDGHKQVLEITSIGFDRDLYFNPGLYLSDSCEI